MKRIEIPTGSAPRDVKVGDVIKFQVYPDNTIVYGVYINHYYDFRNHGEDMCEDDSDMYAVFHVLPLGAHKLNTYYDWEFVENLTDTERKYSERKNSKSNVFLTEG
jgi:hypothetical protein